MYDELKELNRLINKKQEKIDEMKSVLTSISAPIGQRVQNSENDKMSRMMCKIIIAENELDEMIDDYTEKKRKAQQEIFMLPNEDWQDIMYLYYIQDRKLWEIADILSKKRKKEYSFSTVKMKKQRAIKNLKKILTLP